MIPRRLRIIGRRLLIALIERVPLSYYVTVYAVVVGAFGFAFYWLTPSPNGLLQSGASATVSFGTALYFSLITVTTVGYGDVVPIGFARILACFEALFGLTMMGLILAKVSSGRTSYHVLRLFGSDAESRLEAFSAEFDAIEAELSRLGARVLEAFPDTPGGTAPPTQGDVSAAFAAVVRSFHSSTSKLCRYLTDEMNVGYFFSDAPAVALTRTGEALDQAVFVLGQVIIGLGPQARIVLLERASRRQIAEALNRCREVFPEVASRKACRKRSGMRDMWSTVALNFVTCSKAGRSSFS